MHIYEDIVALYHNTSCLLSERATILHKYEKSEHIPCIVHYSRYTEIPAAYPLERGTK